MVFGCIEHQTWAFLRNEGDFSVDKVADGIANVIYRGMLVQAPAASESRLDEIATRLEKVSAAMENRAAG